MPCHAEWYNLSSSQQNWNQLVCFVRTQLLSWGEKIAFQCRNQDQRISAFFFFPPLDAFCTSAVRDDLRFPSKESYLLWEANPHGNPVLPLEKEPGHRWGWEMSFASAGCGLFMYWNCNASSAGVETSWSSHVSALGAVAWCRKCINHRFTPNMQKQIRNREIQTHFLIRGYKYVLTVVQI